MKRILIGIAMLSMAGLAFGDGNCPQPILKIKGPCPDPCPPPTIVEKVVERVVPGPERLVTVPGPVQVVTRTIEVPRFLPAQAKPKGFFFVPLSAFTLSGTNTKLSWDQVSLDGDIPSARYSLKAETYRTYGYGAGLGYQFPSGISVALQLLGTQNTDTDGEWRGRPVFNVEDETRALNHGHGHGHGHGHPPSGNGEDTDISKARDLFSDGGNSQSGYMVTVTIPLRRRQ